jgi:hypothetical protein
LGAFPEQAALEFRQRAKHVKNMPSLRGRYVEASVRLRKPMPFTRRFSMVSINCFIERAKRSLPHNHRVAAARECQYLAQGWSIRHRAPTIAR